MRRYAIAMCLCNHFHFLLYSFGIYTYTPAVKGVLVLQGFFCFLGFLFCLGYDIKRSLDELNLLGFPFPNFFLGSECKERGIGTFLEHNPRSHTNQIRYIYERTGSVL